jgi:hypothetical protein
MAESLLQIFQRHRDCFDFTKEPDWQASAEARQLCNDRQREREQAANEYVSGIVTANEKWAEDINADVSELALSFQRILSKAERKAYQDAAGQFLLYVATALREHRLMQLSPFTRYMMGRSEKAMNVVSGLSRDEAKRKYQSTKEQGFDHVQIFPTDAYPATYSVFGYKPQDNAHSGSNGVGVGNTPAAKKTPKRAKGKRGRPQKEFEDFILIEDKQKVISILSELLDGKIGKDAARIIVACHKGGWIAEPTAASIERQFGIDAAGLKEPLRCNFRAEEVEKMAYPNKPKFKPFSNNECDSIISSIEQRISK